MLSRIYLPFAIRLNTIKYVLNNLYVCSFIVTKLIAKIRMLQGENSAILSAFIKLPLVIKVFVLSILSGRLRQVFTAYTSLG